MSNIALKAPPGATDIRASEDVVREGVIVRHSTSARVIHWSVAVTFFLCLFTGMPIWTPIFGWMAALFGGLEVCRWLHPWTGVAFAVASAAMFVRWIGDMRLEKSEREWANPAKALKFLVAQGESPDVGKYNGGQKLFFFAITLLMLALLLTGLVLWFPRSLSRPVHEWSLVLHDLTFILSAVAIIFHIYLGTAAEPGTFQAMSRGTVDKAWARHHHGRWYRDVTGDRRH